MESVLQLGITEENGVTGFRVIHTPHTPEKECALSAIGLSIIGETETYTRWAIRSARAYLRRHNPRHSK